MSGLWRHRRTRFGNYQLDRGQEWQLFWYTLCSWPTVGTVAVMSLAPLLILALELLGGDWGRSLTDSPTTWPVIAVACLVPLIAGPVLFARPGRRRLNSGLRRMGFPICVKCDYDLKGLADKPLADRCPECGALIADMPPVGRPPRA